MEGSGDLLVVDPDTDARVESAALLRGSGYQVVEAGGCREAVEVAARRPIDLALIEVDFPDGDGYRLARQLRRVDNPAVVFLSAADRNEDILAGFHAGADDFISKRRPRHELLARVTAVMRRTRGQAHVWRVGDLVVDEDAGVVTRAGSVVPLTVTEFDLLLALVRHQGVRLSKRQLLIQVWGDDRYDDNVVERHVSSLRRKLEAHGPRLLHTIRGFGYVLRHHRRT